MNTYPGFYRATDGKEYLYLDKTNYFSFERGIWDKSDHSDNHKKDTNITREYLANTYGEVKSKEHAEFIVKLAEGAGFYLYCTYDNVDQYFSLTDSVLYFWPLKSECKQKKPITIPLPPKEPEPKELLTGGCDCIYNDEIFIYLCKSPLSGNAIIQRKSNLDCDIASVSFAELKKPLTPEEELARLIYGLGGANTDYCEHIAKAIINGEIKGLCYKPE